MTEAATKPDEIRCYEMNAVFTVADVARAVDFYTRVLGFDLQWKADDGSYAIVRRDACALHLQPAARNELAKAACGKSTIYVFTAELSALHDSIVAAGGKIAVPPCDTPYGLREFALRDPDGNGITFAQEIAR